MISSEFKPASDLKIIDMSAVLTGPFATHFLADHGADVIKIEAPSGDITRWVGESPEPGMASIFQHINRSKRSVVLDLKTEDGLDALKKLLESADAFVFNARPSSMERLGLAYHSVQAINPSIVYCGITGFGEGGRYGGQPAYDDLIQGAVGIPDLVEKSGSEPRYAPMALADRVVGLYAVVALTMALLHRQRTGEGCCVQTPMFESMAHFVLVEHMFYKSFEPSLGGTGNPRALDHHRRPYRTSDGYICVLPYTDRHWRDLFGVIGVPEKANDPKFSRFNNRLANISELYQLLEASLLERSTSDWLDVFGRTDIPACPMNSIDDLLADLHLHDVGFFQKIRTPKGGTFVGLSSPFVWNNQSPASIGLAPSLGEHTEEVLHNIHAPASSNECRRASTGGSRQ